MDAHPSATRLRYTFHVVPKSLVPRFIPKRHLLCPEGRWWRRGMVSELNGARALVRADMAAHTVSVSVVPPEERGLSNEVKSASVADGIVKVCQDLISHRKQSR